MNEGIERIKTLASEIKDKPLLKIIEYLLSRKDMNDKYLNEEKNLKQMVDYIKQLAKKESTNGVAIVEDEDVYAWAIHYWDESNENLKIKTTNESITKETIKKERIEEPKKIPKKKNWVPEGQLSLFDM